MTTTDEVASLLSILMPDGAAASLLNLLQFADADPRLTDRQVEIAGSLAIEFAARKPNAAELAA